MLIKCIECGKQVSDSVKICIHCKANSKGVKCSQCDLYFPESDIDPSLPLRFCASCSQKLISNYFTDIKIKCPECGESVNFLSNYSLKDILQNRYSNKCLSCGYDKGLLDSYSCTKCQLPIFANLHSYIQRYSKHQYDDDYDWTGTFHHPVCEPEKKRAKNYSYIYKYYDKKSIKKKEKRLSSATLNNLIGLFIFLTVILIIIIVIWLAISG